jgi:hypothetical protein
LNTRRLTVVAWLLALVGALVAAFAPLGRSVEGMGSTAGGVTEVRSSHVSLFQTDGAWVLMVVSVPVLVALIPVIVRRRTSRIVAAVLLWIGCVVGMWSVGLFFVPAAIAMTVAATRREPDPIPPMPLLRT